MSGSNLQNLEYSTSNDLTKFYDNINSKFSRDNPMMLIILTVVIVGYYLVFSSTSVTENALGSNVSSGLSFTEIIMWGLFIFLIIINGLQYFFNINIKAVIKNIFSPRPEVDITILQDEGKKEPVPEIMIEKQVFHIPDNKYTYEESRALCKAYGGRLANYNEVESAYENGAEWCGYGWSKDQLALYPTQHSTYKKLQKIKGHKHDCGRPGINGGYIKNPNVRFGANCYGYKPEITLEEIELMDEINPYPITKKDKRFEKMVDNYKRKLPNILVSPFNNNRWSLI